MDFTTHDDFSNHGSMNNDGDKSASNHRSDIEMDNKDIYFHDKLTLMTIDHP